MRLGQVRTQACEGDLFGHLQTAGEQFVLAQVRTGELMRQVQALSSPCVLLVC